MSTRKRTFTQELSHCNACLDARLRQFGMTVKTYKLLKATTQLVGVLACSYAIHLTGEAYLPLVVIAGIILGPEYVETVIMNSSADSGSDDA